MLQVNMYFITSCIWFKTHTLVGINITTTGLVCEVMIEKREHG